MSEITILYQYQFIAMFATLIPSAIIGMFLTFKTDSIIPFFFTMTIGIIIIVVIASNIGLEIETIQEQRENKREQIRVAIEIADCQTLKIFYYDFHKSWKDSITKEYIIDCVQEKSDLEMLLP